MTEEELKVERDRSKPLAHLPTPTLVNGIPISKPIDGSDDDSIEKMIEEQTNPAEDKQPQEEEQPKQAKRRAVAKAKPVVQEPEPEPTPPPPPPEPTKTSKALSGKDAISIFKKAVGAGIIPVKLYSTGEEVKMRELTVTDQKTLSKTALINSNRRDILYNAQNTLINSCVKDDGFDIRNYTEFDRICILSRLYQQNYFSNDVKYTCKKCGEENVYQLDFGKILERMENAWSPDKVYVLKHMNNEFHFTLGWPMVSTMSDFYTKYYSQYQKANEKTQTTIDQLSNVEYLTMFIRKVELFNEGSSEGISLNLDDYTYSERADLIDSLPQGLVFDDEHGIIPKVISDFTERLNKAFQYEKCQYCGAESEEGIGSIADFI